MSIIPKIRATLKAKLAELIPAWSGKVLDIQLPDVGLSGASAVITFAEEVQKSSWVGYRRIVKIWPYALPGSGGMEQVEAWCETLIQKLHNTRLVDDAGEAFTCVYLGAADSDRTEPLGGLVTRPIRFGIYVPEPEANVETDADKDPWLTALNNWTAQQLGESWTIYNDAWPSGYVERSVLWRLTSISTTAPGTTAFELRKQWMGHIYGHSEQENKRIAAQLVERLNAQVKIVLDSATRRYLTVGEASADVQADAFLNGQIRLTLLRRAQRDLPDAPLVREVHNKPVLDG
ncbi:hypothetical protein [Paenibacillus sp. WLX2291]|uniref:hypothetical protein n=1 Tax=Paenibacillus sp. WLX2291 TaxID=3296934 RepID=UPI003983DB83